MVVWFMPLRVNTAWRVCITAPKPSPPGSSSPMVAAASMMPSRRPTSSTTSSARSITSGRGSTALPARRIFSIVRKSWCATSISFTVRPAPPRTRYMRPISSGSTATCPAAGAGLPPASACSASSAASRSPWPMNFGSTFTQTMIAPSEPNT